MPPPPPIITLCLDAMRTRFELVLTGAEESRLREIGRAALREIEDAEARLSLFRPDSLLSHINRTALREPVRLDHDTLGLLLACREVWELSNGAFDPTVAPRMTALGLHEAAALPDGDLATGFDSVVLDETGATVRFTAPRALDLGAIAKGHALDLAGRSLREAGITSALLHGGTSSVLAIGTPPDQPGWKIALRPPTPDAGPPPGPALHFTLRDSALGVSAHHARRLTRDGIVVGHILDPRTGESSAETCALAAVSAPTAALADAWSTAALVLGKRPDGMPVEYRCVTM